MNSHNAIAHYAMTPNKPTCDVVISNIQFLISIHAIYQVIIMTSSSNSPVAKYEKEESLEVPELPEETNEDAIGKKQAPNCRTDSCLLYTGCILRMAQLFCGETIYNIEPGPLLITWKSHAYQIGGALKLHPF